MIIQVNTSGIYIDISFSPENVSKLNAEKGVIPKENIALFKILPENTKKGHPQKVVLSNIFGTLYEVEYQNVVSINNINGYAVDPDNTPYDSNEKVFEKINELLFGFIEP